VRRGSTVILRWVSLVMIFAAVLLTVFELVTYSRIRTRFPSGLIIAGVSAGGLDQQETADRLTQAYGVPIELHYGDAIVQVKPSVVGFELHLQGMLAAADLQRINEPFWSAFWDYLWGRLPTPGEVPLSASISDERLRVFLKDEISQRYDRPPSPPVPVPGTVQFEKGDSGSSLDIDRAVVLIDDALRSPASRVVNLSVGKVGSPRPSLNHLEILLKQTIDLSGFDGVIELYMLDLQTNQELHFAYQKGAVLTPDIAFTAASTMKIPIMVSVMSRVPEPVPQGIADQLVLMIERSENDPADRLMETVMDQTLGPLKVTDDLKTLGFANTFLAGYFYQGAPLLAHISTPANQRTDINTSPDSYNQTTPLEMGELLFDIYQCSQNGGGTLAAVFPGKITQTKCQSMINYLEGNRIGVLMQAGLPEGTKIANKHGWITESDGLLHTIGDAGIIFTPGGNFILAIYMNNRKQLLFDPANDLVAKLTRGTYNYFNLGSQ
jgi:beta-lactamase class A